MTGIRLEEFDITKEPATIVTQPQSQLAIELQSVTFTVVANGAPTPTLQWYRNDSPISGATSSSYTIAKTQVTDNGAVFKVIASNTISNVVYTAVSSNA